MATPASPEAIEIRRRGRRRLLGAIVIVALLVVFIPMLLDTEPKRAPTEPAMQIPPRQGIPPLPAPARAKPAPPPAPAPAKSASAPGAARSGGKPPAQEAAAVARVTPEGPKAAAAHATPRLEGFAVQVGAFRDEETLRQARAKLAAAGIAHYTERLDGSAGGLTRLRAGPFSTREAAERARAALERISLHGQVVPLP